MVLSNPYYVLLGIALGLSLAAPPGPVNAIIAAESLKSRFHGFSVGLGAATADFTYFILTFFFASIIPAVLVNYLYLLGGILLLFMAYKIKDSKNSNREPKGNYFVGYVMAITSPFNLSWWLTAGLFLLKNISIFSLLGLFIGILIWISLFSALIFKLRKKINNKIIQYISSAILALFGIFMLYQSILLIL